MSVYPVQQLHSLMLGLILGMCFGGTLQWRGQVRETAAIRTQLDRMERLLMSVALPQPGPPVGDDWPAPEKAGQEAAEPQPDEVLL